VAEDETEATAENDGVPETDADPEVVVVTVTVRDHVAVPLLEAD
jgi:hypothetical protein